MICSDGIKDAVAGTLALQEPPHAVDTLKDQLYTCTYHLSEGPLVLSVDDATDLPSGRAYFDTLEQQLAPTQPIEGLASLGLPAFETDGGSVVFIRDGKTLHVDASRLTSTLGPRNLSRTDVAYQVATDVIACWTAHN